MWWCALCITSKVINHTCLFERLVVTFQSQSRFASENFYCFFLSRTNILSWAVSDKKGNLIFSKDHQICLILRESRASKDDLKREDAVAAGGRLRYPGKSRKACCSFHIHCCRQWSPNSGESNTFCLEVQPQ